MNYDIAVIGCGVVGAMIASRLSAYRITVAVIEADYDVARGASGANSGIAHAGFDPVSGTLKAKMNSRAMKLLPSLAAELGFSFRPCGSLVVGFTEADEAVLRALMARGAENGIGGLEMWDRDRLLSEEPALSPKVYSAMFARDAGIVCPYETTIAAAENAAINGVDFYFSSPVTAISATDGSFTLTAGGNTVTAKYIINSAGAAAADVARLAGEAGLLPRIIPRRGEYLLADKTAGGIVSHTLFTVPSAEGKGILVSPTVDGNLLIGPNAEEIDDRSDKSTTASGMAAVLAGGRRLVPGIPVGKVITSFAGVRPTPDSGDFFIQPSETVPRLLNLCGIESPGLVSSPAIAEYVITLLGDMGLKLEPRDDYIKGRPTHIRYTEADDALRRELIARDPRWGRVVCRCETVTEAEVVDAIHRPIPAVTVDMVKRRTRSGMGRCQGGFCSPSIVKIISRELGIPPEAVTLRGSGSYILSGGRRNNGGNR